MSKQKSLKVWLWSILAFVVVVAAVVGAAVVWAMNGRYEVQAAESIAEPSPVMHAPKGDVPNVQAAVRRAAADPALGLLSASVTDVETGEVLWAKDENRKLTPASSTKLYTAAAALLALDHDSRWSTDLIQDPTDPGRLILRSDGDVSLSRDGEGFFTDAASIAALAKKAKKQLGGQPVTSIVVDNSIRSGDLFNKTWDRADIDGGNVANLDAVMLDAGRLNPYKSDSARSHTPGEDVGRAVAEALGADAEVTVVEEATPNLGDARPIASVQSAPLKVRLRDMLVHSDNIMAEAVGREIASAQGSPLTFEGATSATLAVLKQHGVDVQDAELFDNSGMSEKNRLTAHELDGVLSHKEVRPMLDMLPVSSVEGTLATRYGAGSGAEASAGWVRAKTGTLSGVNALAGTVMTDSGRALTFAFLSNESDPNSARPALDRLANAVRTAS
ncbi:D-alanyl-D-alanine carboxypeptidase/D-alanyl-D-alanine-endopeptidase [uncultured Corynebacterium sp.]|uniref:D-alanyl-D-alanine carboxypeptidase/D-alanyl-D-alanine endopeptidase n=1 Tax=uncultured Corynebacterium sp. TaxID=159447 RepID=UPI0025F74FD2|nr:D-alanyl-D-alanine carboxypeptidase/D-alanyl-D-alanine-endopeptidase [uncultured Corynebacterium sp.]